MRRKSLSPIRRFLKQFEFFGKDVMGRLVAALFASKHRVQTIDAAEIKTILLYKIDERLGNLILLTPFLAMLRENFPQARITYCAAAKMTKLLVANPAIDEAVAFRKWAFSSPDGWPRMLHRLRKARFDLVIDCSHPTSKSLTHALLTRFSAGKYTIGVDRPATPLGRYFDCAVKIPLEIKAEREQYPYLLTPFAIAPAPVPALNYCPTQEVEQLAPAVRELLAAPPKVIINMGAGTKDRFISPVFIKKIVVFFEENNVTTMITWGPAEEQLAKDVIPENARNITLAPPTTVNELYYLLKAAKLVICGDTGPMHLAVASGTPTLALFIKGQPERFGHNYPPHKVLLLSNEDEDLQRVKDYYLSLNI